MSNRPIHLEAKLPKGVLPSLESNEILINKFLKACSKESLMQFLYEKSPYTKRFEKPSVSERKLRMKYKRNARIANLEKLSDKKDNNKSKKKS